MFVFFTNLPRITIISSHFIYSHPILSELISLHLIAYHPISSHPIPFHLIIFPLVTSHCIPPNLISSHSIPSHFLSHFISSHIFLSHSIPFHFISSHPFPYYMVYLIISIFRLLYPLQYINYTHFSLFQCIHLIQSHLSTHSISSHHACNSFYPIH